MLSWGQGTLAHKQKAEHMNDESKAAYTENGEVGPALGAIRSCIASLGDQLEKLAKAQAELRFMVRPVTAPIPTDPEPALSADDGATCDLHADLLVLLASARGLHADTVNLAEAIRI